MSAATLAKQICGEYQGVVDLLLDQNLVLDMNALRFNEVSRGVFEVTWDNHLQLSYLFEEYPTISSYLEIIRRRDYCLCLLDGSILQIYYKLIDDEVSAHRLCFLPCPFPFAVGEWEGVGLGDVPSLMNADEMVRQFRMATPIRFDFDANFSDDRHAHSHVTINKQTCRIPAYGPVSPGHFMRFVLRYFYEEHVNFGAISESLVPRYYTRTLHLPSPHEIHVESAVGHK